MRRINSLKRIGLLMKNVGHTAIYSNNGCVALTLLHLSETYIVDVKEREFLGSLFRMFSSRICVRPFILMNRASSSSTVTVMGQCIAEDEDGVVQMPKDPYIHITGLCDGQQRRLLETIALSRRAGYMPIFVKDPKYLRDPKLFDPLKPIRPHSFA
ncbi:putative ribosomal protein S18 [Dirofilaria immitis]|nr:putative ribosomal protein S18 [Dirofilaria immitis]